MIDGAFCQVSSVITNIIIANTQGLNVYPWTSPTFTLNPLRPVASTEHLTADDTVLIFNSYGYYSHVLLRCSHAILQLFSWHIVKLSAGPQIKQYEPVWPSMCFPVNTI